MQDKKKREDRIIAHHAISTGLDGIIAFRHQRADCLIEGVIMATVSAAHRELITCNGGKRQFQFVSVYRSFVGFRALRNLFILPF